MYGCVVTFLGLEPIPNRRNFIDFQSRQWLNLIIFKPSRLTSNLIHIKSFVPEKTVTDAVNKPSKSWFKPHDVH